MESRRPRSPSAPYLDPRIGEWCFDASPLINAHGADPFLLRIMGGFKGRAHLLADVLDELRGPAGRTVQIAGWCTKEELVLAEDRELFSELRWRWGSKPGRDRGEAASIVACRRNKWRLVIDDRVGYRAALDYGISATRTPHLLVATVRAQWWAADEAWQAYTNLLELRRREADWPHLGEIPWKGRDEFVRLCAVETFDSS